MEFKMNYCLDRLERTRLKQNRREVKLHMLKEAIIKGKLEAAPAAICLGIILVCLCACASSSPEQHQHDISASPCMFAGVELWKRGDELRRQYSDNHGDRVELWCDRDVFSAHWDLRISEGDEGGLPPEAPRSATIGGCFFNNGESTGPTIYEGNDYRFTKVLWSNQDPANEHRKYDFVYDYSNDTVTVIATTPGSSPVQAVVRPQESWEKLSELLPHS